MNELIPQGDGFELKPYKLVISGPVKSFEEWKKMGHGLRIHRESNPYWIGDWLLLFEGEWGEMYSQAIGITGLDESTLSHYKSICKWIPQEKRLVSMAHYRLLRNLEDKEREKLVVEASEKDWSVMELREKIISSKFIGSVKEELEKVFCAVCGKPAKDPETWEVCQKCAKTK